MDLGAFSGNPKTEWLSGPPEDRTMRLLEEFWYTDPAGRRWTAPAASVIDGASIPETLWSSVGSPYTGDYRRASIVHDIACDDAAVARGDADTMFYFACLCGGCTPAQAKLLYAGVRLGSWLSAKPLLALNLGAKVANTYKLPGLQSVHELEVRARFTLIANALDNIGEGFDAIRQLVDRHLAPAAA